MSRVPQFAHETSSAVRLAGPGAPAVAGGDKVPVGGLRLLERGRAVAEQAPSVRAHLEEAEVLAVLGRRVSPDSQRETASASWQYRPKTRQITFSGFAACTAASRRAFAFSRARDSRRPPACGRARGWPNGPAAAAWRTPEAGVAQQPLVGLQKGEDLLVLLHRGQVPRQLRTQGGLALRLGRRRNDEQKQGARAQRQGFQGVTSISGTGLTDRVKQRPLVSLLTTLPQGAQGHARFLTKCSKSPSRSLSDNTTTVRPCRKRKRPGGALTKLRDRDSNANFRTGSRRSRLPDLRAARGYGKRHAASVTMSPVTVRVGPVTVRVGPVTVRVGPVTVWVGPVRFRSARSRWVGRSQSVPAASPA